VATVSRRRSSLAGWQRSTQRVDRALPDAAQPMIAKHRTYLLLILLLSVLLRVGLAFSLGDAITETRGGTFDQISYDALALRVATGHGFSFGADWWPGVRADQPTAFWSYLYTLYLAAVYTLFGHHPLVARLIQAVLVGLAMPWLTYRIGTRLFGSRPALIAAAISAFYLYFVTYAASLMSEALYMVGILWTVDVSMRLAEALQHSRATARRRLGLGVELGLAMGLTLLLRQVIGVFLAALAVWFFWLAWRRHWLKQAMVPLATAALVLVLLCLPFILRNYRVFGVIAMPNTNVGINFFWANHPIYGTQFEATLDPSHGVSYQDLIPQELRGLDDARLDRALLARGLQFVRDDPGRYLRLSLSRIPIYFQFWPTAKSTLLSNAARLLSFGVFLPFMLYGLVLALRNARPGGALRGQPAGQVADPTSSAETTDSHAAQADLRPAFLALVLLFMAVYTTVHLASWANVRYRLPVDALWILFAGYGLDDLLRRLVSWRRRAPRSPAGAEL
jgi:4-amino-4-deoxy-L-arabinose transferase-like glycosyltransferase